MAGRLGRAVHDFRPSVAVAVLALTAACGSSSASGTSSQVVARAPDATTAAGPAEVNVDEGSTHAHGEVDLATDKLRLSVTTTQQGTAGPATEVVAIGPDVWSRVAGQAQWSHSSGPTGGLLSLPGLVSGDVRALVALVRGASSVDPYGGVQVRNFSTLRYDLKTDPQKAAAQSPANAPQLLALAGAVDHTVRLALYVDHDSRIRRIEAPEDFTTTTVATRSDASAVVATVDFIRFGLADDIVPPPPS